MDCSRAFEYMMKYLDEEINREEERLLFEHLDSCESCTEEFEALKCTLSMLHEVEMEEAPEGLEGEVMRKIEMGLARDKSLLGPWSLKKGALMLGASLLGWLALTLLFQYTPILEVILERFKDIQVLTGGLLELTSSFLDRWITGLSMLFSLGKAFGIVERALIEACSSAIIAAASGLIVTLMAYKYMYRIIRR